MGYNVPSHGQCDTANEAKRVSLNIAHMMLRLFKLGVTSAVVAAQGFLRLLHHDGRAY